MSEIPRLRSAHTTSGYRDGIAASKSQYVQEGFDEGFALGAEIGIRVGWVLGVLEGVVVGLRAASVKTDRDAVEGAEDPEKRVLLQEKLEEARTLWIKAREELGVTGVFGREYFGEEGVWKFEVHGPADRNSVSIEILEGSGTSNSDNDGANKGPEPEALGEAITFRDVADAHPLIRKWNTTVWGLASRWGIDLGVLERREREESPDELQSLD